MATLRSEILNTIVDLQSVGFSPEAIEEKLKMAHKTFLAYQEAINKMTAAAYMNLATDGYKLMMLHLLRDKVELIKKLEKTSNILVSRIYHKNKNGTITDVLGKETKPVYALAQIAGVLNTAQNDLEKLLHDSVMPITWNRIVAHNMSTKGKALETPPADKYPVVNLEMFPWDVKDDSKDSTKQA